MSHPSVVALSPEQMPCEADCTQNSYRRTPTVAQNSYRRTPTAASR
jgi:hypothetical protein